MSCYILKLTRPCDFGFPLETGPCVEAGSSSYSHSHSSVVVGNDVVVGVVRLCL